MGALKVQGEMEINIKIDSGDNNIIYPLVDGVAFSWNSLMLYGKKK